MNPKSAERTSAGPGQWETSRCNLRSSPRISPVQAGFTLVETLVAFTLLALFLAAFYALHASTSVQLAMAEDYGQAIVHAESRLAALGIEAPLQPGVQSGQLDDRYRWHSEVAPYEPEGRPVAATDDPWQPWRVRIEVSWEGRGQTRSVVLESLRLAGEGRLPEADTER